MCLDASTIASCFLKLATDRYGDARQMKDPEMQALHSELVRKLEVALPHTSDDQCVFDEDRRLCVVCNAQRHKYPCVMCAGHVYHFSGCTDGKPGTKIED